MNALHTLFLISMVAWFLSEFLYKNMLKSGKEDKRDKDKSTLNILWLAIPFSIAAAVTVSNISSLPIIHHIWIYYVGEAFILIGIIRRSIHPYRNYFQVYYYQIAWKILYSRCYH